MAVAGIQPRETGQEPAAEGFLSDPQRSEGQGVGQRRLIAAQPARPNPGGQGKEPGNRRREKQHQEAGQQYRSAAEVMNAVVDPAGAGTEQAETETPAATQGLTWVQFAQAGIEQADGEQCQWPDIERRQSQGGDCTGRHGQQVTGPAGAGCPAHFNP
ncbi:hypothetical protein D9M73_161200 [compost metagenome]